jgi:23S rRNA (uridine2552-2'-O)-methyltransferase
LDEIQKKFKILKSGFDVLDLGAAPGSWLQYAASIVGPKAKLIGIDLIPIKPLSQNIITFIGDIFDNDTFYQLQKIHPATFPIILSDMAPKTSGIKELDQARSLELNQRVVRLSEKLLAPNGFIIIKIFQGGDLPLFLQELQSKFSEVKILKPLSSRERSYETYIILKK